MFNSNALPPILSTGTKRMSLALRGRERTRPYRITTRPMPRGLTISAATFLHFCMAANSGADHIRLLGQRRRVGFPAAHRSVRDGAYGPGALAKSACTEHTTGVVTAVHPVESDRQRLPVRSLVNCHQEMSQLACCPTKGQEGCSRPERNRQ